MAGPQPLTTRGLRIREAAETVDPNDPTNMGQSEAATAACPCGSGKKFKTLSRGAGFSAKWNVAD